MKAQPLDYLFRSFFKSGFWGPSKAVVDFFGAFSWGPPKLRSLWVALKRQKRQNAFISLSQLEEDPLDVFYRWKNTRSLLWAEDLLEVFLVRRPNTVFL